MAGDKYDRKIDEFRIVFFFSPSVTIFYTASINLNSVVLLWIQEFYYKKSSRYLPQFRSSFFYDNDDVKMLIVCETITTVTVKARTEQQKDV